MGHRGYPRLDDPSRLAHRYAGSREPLLDVVPPSGRHITLASSEASRRPIVLSEVGGIRVASPDGEAWGYTTVSSGRELGALYERSLAAVRESETLAGFCWTQLTDTYQEQNGLLHADRSPKVPFEEIAFSTWGPRLFDHIAKEQTWPEPTPPGASTS